jgi:methionyl-tRNA formyltransferase
MIKVTLFLMSEKGLKVLESVVENRLSNLIDKVVINTDKSVINDYSDDLKKLCEENNLKCCFLSDLTTIESQYSIAISWRWLIKESNSKLIVLHDSLLPKYRGFSPLVNSLINGEKYIGVTALFASKEYDKGPIIYQEKREIEYPITIKEAIEHVSLLYSELVLKILKALSSNLSLNSQEQNEKMASYSLWRDENDYNISWEKSAEYISRFVDAVGFPYKGSKTKINGKIVIIQRVSIVEDLVVENRDLGKIIFFMDEKPVVVCGSGLIKIEEAIFEETGESIFPLKKFRIRFD